jgi:DNA-binding CsgD family transcriptional regulator
VKHSAPKAGSPEGDSANSSVAERLVESTSPAAGSSLLIALTGLTASGRSEVVAQARTGWLERGLAVLEGRPAAAPAGGVAGAIYDALLGSAAADPDPSAPTLWKVPTPGIPSEAAARIWGDLMRWHAGRQPLVLVLQEVDVWPPGERGLLEHLAADLGRGRPSGTLVVNPVSALPSEWSAVRAMHCPEEAAPERIVDASGTLGRIHPELARGLEKLSTDRPVMLDVARAWRRLERIRLVDGMWMPTGPLPVPDLPANRPYLAVLNTLTDGQRAVLAAVAVLAPVDRGDLVDVLAAAFPYDGGLRIQECLDALQARELIVPGVDGLAVPDPLVAVAVAGQVGPASLASWRERTAARGPAPAGASFQVVDVPEPAADAGGNSLRLKMFWPAGDGSAVVDHARWHLARDDRAGLSVSVPLAAVVLARRGLLDRARVWLAAAQKVCPPEDATTLVWATAEIRALEGETDALGAGKSARWYSELAWLSFRDSLVSHQFEPTRGAVDDDFFSAERRLGEDLDAVACGAVPTDLVPPMLRAVLAEARQRRSVLVWCRAARLARGAGLTPGSAPLGPDGANDVQRAVLSLLAAGLTTKRCAEVLSIQVRAVENRVRDLFEQSDTSSRAHLVREYVRGRVFDLSA